MTVYNHRDDDSRLPRPRQAVYLDSFAIDRTEMRVLGKAKTIFFVPEVSGYTPSGSDPERAATPVVCVTRDEARAFCDARGGRLPSAAEWLKAGRGPHPADDPYPWGQEPPPVGDSTWPAWGFEAFIRDYAAVGLSDRALATEPADSRPMGASPWEVLGLAGNASELLLDCLEDVEAVYGAGGPAIRPTSVVRDRCGSAVLIAGSNWGSGAIVEPLAAQSVYFMRDGADAIRYIETELAPGEPVGHLGGMVELERMFGATRPLPGTPSDEAGNLRRSWRVGFRCAYDLREEGP